MENDIFKEITLDNKLKLEFLNKSKKIAPSIFYVCIAIHISIPLEKRWFAQVSLNEIKFNTLVNTLGKKVIFKRNYEKHFVEEHLKDKYIKSIIENILTSTTRYLGHQKFPGKYILKSFFEQESKLKTDPLIK